ncbi:unnamed protein product, partial [Didymodactylos carnosus]
MRKLLAFISLVCYLFYSCDCALPDSQLIEQTLKNSLFSTYDKTIRPDDQVSVDITATLQQIVAIDEKQQIMTSSSFISQTWYDYRLTWANNASNNNISVLMLPVKNLWIPDTMILNSADTSGYFTVNDYSLASVDYRGQVYMILPALSVRTRCNFLVQKFPFDKQLCSINLTSWSQGANRILYTENRSLVIDLSEYSEHPLWKLNGTDMIVTEAADRAPFEDTYNDIISIQLYLQRKPMYFMLNGIFACLILNAVTLIAFALPFATQISLSMICFMTYSVYSLSFSSLFPQQSDYLMTITLYFLLSICWTLIAMLWFVICNYFITKVRMPRLLYAFCELLQRVSTPRPKKDDKTDKKDVIVENGEIKKSVDEESTKATRAQRMKCVCCQKLFVSCLQRHHRVESIDKKQHVLDDDMKPIRTNPTDVKPIETEQNETN